ncbi:MAG: ABC transporter permease [Pseudacidovorax sp.]|uniref:ABC transporter permease n=1 Tax=Pseudacidovorax sp. TaxID=1934311 RepID=UPI001B7C0920|nr:ABC transporter permease [Pseudacidovorax sp.]MBP6898003.1 ABC transporter permease [Pseudacidovorax sp.]
MPEPVSPFTRSLRREARRLASQPWELAMVSWVPALAAALMWWIFSAGLPNRLPIGVLDEDHSAISRQIERFLEASPGLQVAERYADAAEMDRALVAGRVHAAVWMPRELSRELKQGRAGQVVLLHNAQRGTHSSLIQRDVRTAVGTVSAGIELTARAKRGESAPTARAHLDPVRANTVALFNTSSNYEQFLGAALIPALLHIFAMTAGAWTLGRELRDRSLGEWLAPGVGANAGTAAGANWGDAAAALAGKLLLPWASLSVVGLLALLGLTLGRGWHPAGSLLWVGVALVLFLGLSVAMGAFLAALTRSLRTALSGTGFITAPAFAFGGVGFPLVAMPAAARAWALALPYTHYARVQIEQLQMGAPLAYSMATPLWMAVAATALLAASAGLVGRATKAPESWGKR